MNDTTPSLRQLKLYPAFPMKPAADRPGLARRRKLHWPRLNPVVGALLFLALSTSVVIGGGSALVFNGNRAISTVSHLNKVVPTEIATGAKAPQEQAPLAQAAAPTPAPNWQVVNSKPVPVSQVQAKAAIVVDNLTGEVLEQKNSDQPMAMASLTKLMTAYVTLDRAKMDDLVTVSSGAAATPPTNLPLGAGEKLTVHDLLEALLMTSANDAANALADGLGGHPDFVAAMNAKATQLGLKQTHYASATGFDEPGQQSTAADLAVLAHELFTAHPELEGIIQQPTAVVPATDTHRQYDLQNFHPLVGVYPGFVAGKPGFTGEAGMCLLTIAERDGKSVTAVVLNSPNIAYESSILLDGGFAELGK